MFDIYKYDLDELEYDELMFIKNMVHYVNYSENEIITYEGKIENYLYFIESGIVRFWKIKENKEVTFDFVSDSSVANCYESYLTNLPSKINMQAITKVSGWRLQKEDAEKFFKLNIKTRDLRIKLMDKLLILKFQREIELTCDSPKERYLNLLKDHPELLRNVPLKYIASYLAITPETLSRIRNVIF